MRTVNGLLSLIFNIIVTAIMIAVEIIDITILWFLSEQLLLSVIL